MGMLKLFSNRRSSSEQVDSKRGNEILNEGILFEDRDEFLKWGSSIRKLSNTIRNKKISGDRTVYYWGKHTVLNGLELDLTTMFWRYRIESLFKKFNHIEFWAIGDKEAENYLELIRGHIENQFGNPTKEETENREVSLEWEINNVKISLYFFEQHVYKLHLKISN